MSELQVGVRDLKNHLSQYLARVKKGETVVITEHGKPIGRILPTEMSLEERIQAMVGAGLAAWNGQRLRPSEPVVSNLGNKQISDLLIEDRER